MACGGIHSCFCGGNESGGSMGHGMLVCVAESSSLLGGTVACQPQTPKFDGWLSSAKVAIFVLEDRRDSLGICRQMRMS